MGFIAEDVLLPRIARELAWLGSQRLHILMAFHVLIWTKRNRGSCSWPSPANGVELMCILHMDIGIGT